MRIIEFYSEQKICSYIPTKISYFYYLYIEECKNSFYRGLLERGWRRFGKYFFVPICPDCKDCVSMRQIVQDFSFSKNHKRVFAKNKSVKLIISRPKVDDERLCLYDKYHKYMVKKKGWEYKGIDTLSYQDMFVDGFMDFGYEFAYCIDDKLIGLGLVDAFLDSMSAIYFFYDPDYEDLSLGTLNILSQIRTCKEKNLKYFYPGYWIKDHYCMGYKERFKPFEILVNAPDLFDIPLWKNYQKEEDEVE
ncbi:arginyltransferase [Helicobacter sp. 13S00477-4]|uniref:arginyltransferase n=1 Tax=Helicobacter sp. 13S00477-4 TaxID=1905759 RepID=UPI000BA59DEF|nr:arginyltransferase [Helicobacter sp. 13S00477-4]PAF52123.1 arginyltransferase [Helicobacter sp. 13S00477-4]